ncbi:MAG: shikimate dehydrogenase [Acidimicrobiia bacterium]|nr:shikimate dehydrogenase [Acidimicrobiia bacterium]
MQISDFITRPIRGYRTAVGFLDQIVGSFSTGADGNPTVAMMDASFAHEGLPWRYVNCEVPAEALAAAVAGAAAMGWRGFNCSIPHKQTVIGLLDALAPAAEVCHAVNCVVTEPDGRSIGHNTDGRGFLDSLIEKLDPVGSRVLLIGSGGAAHAIAAELALAGAGSVAVTSRNAATGASLVELVNGVTAGAGRFVDWPWGSDPIAVPDDVDVVVQATPVGMTPNDSETVPVDWDNAGADTIAADVVINPPRTRFLVEAEAAGAVILDGTGMLVNQAAENIRLWAGVDVDRSVLRSALEATF